MKKTLGHKAPRFLFVSGREFLQSAGSNGPIAFRQLKHRVFFEAPGDFAAPLSGCRGEMQQNDTPIQFFCKRTDRFLNLILAGIRIGRIGLVDFWARLLRNSVPNFVQIAIYHLVERFIHLITVVVPFDDVKGRAIPETRIL